MSYRRDPVGVLLGLCVAALISLVASCPLRAEEEAAAPAWEVSCGVRGSDSSGLGYDKPGFGAWCWRDHAGEKWIVRTELLGTTASKGDGVTDYGAVVLLEERRALRGGFWWGVGTEWTWTDGADWSDRLTLAVGFSDETVAGHGQALTLRLLGPDSTAYQTHGAMIRYESLYPRLRLVIEAQELAFEVGDDRQWGRRLSVLIGYRWRSAR